MLRGIIIAVKMSIKQRFLNEGLAKRYKSSSQKIRVLTESWVGEEIFCPSCGANVNRYEHNRPVADFYCPVCKEEYELKSKGGIIGRKVVDGAYKAMIERLASNHNPNLFLLGYEPKSYEVSNLFAIPKYFFVPEIIEKRMPLSQFARRAGWVGCNIILHNIPQAGKIYYIQNKVILPKTTILESWKKTLFLKKEAKATERGWTLDIMNCLDKLDKKEFLLAEVYTFENELKSRHPSNLHIKDKIRQQLQILRDNGYLEFLGRGEYRLV
jgi:type II restriction enzyme